MSVRPNTSNPDLIKFVAAPGVIQLVRLGSRQIETLAV
jgi:hypothetical protein